MVVLHAILGLVLGFSLYPQNIYSDGWTKKSTLTATEPLEVPGMILEPGTYTVNLEAGSSRRSVVQILNAEGKILTRLLAIPDYRARENMSENVFTYHEIEGAGPKVLQSWYYPGDLNGLEFVYPKERAKSLAKATQTHVAASNGLEAKDAIVAMTPTGVEVLIDGPDADAARPKNRQ
jgi:hypothetical protein